MGRLLDTPLRPALLSLLVPVAHFALVRFEYLCAPTDIGISHLSTDILTASGFLASMAGVVVVFLVSDRGVTFRNVRKQLGSFFVPQAVGLFALPAIAMFVAILTAFPAISTAAIWALDWAICLLLIGAGYQFFFLYVCANAAVTQDREEEARERRRRLKDLSSGSEI